MADNADDSGKQDAAEPRAGQRLANARRNNNISMREIAKVLHLDEVKVQALEDNRFDVLGAPVFAKGYLRKYAQLVNVPIDDVLADYYRLNRAVGAPPVVGPPRRKPSRNINVGPWLGAILLLAVVAAAAYWWMNRAPETSGAAPVRSAPLPPRTREPGQEDRPSVASASSETATPPTASPQDTPGAEIPAADPAPGVSTPAADATTGADTPAPDTVQLQLRFSGDCWTEVTDNAGRRLYFGLGTDGRAVTVSGTPPLRVLLGNNDNVSVIVNGSPYTVSAAQLRGNTARLTIGSP